MEPTESESAESTYTRVTESSHPKPTRGRLGLAYSLLNFPGPHQLGQSTGLRRSKSLRLNSYTAAASSPGTSNAVNNTLRVLSQEIGIEETDYHPPAKKPRLLSPPEAIITTYDNAPLKDFSLFLPSKLPAAIPNSAPILREFVFKTTATYLRLWNLNPKMNCIEIRLPILYEEKFSNSPRFLRDFISVVFNEIPDVRSICDLYIPKVELEATTDLNDIFSGMIGKAKVTHLYLPLASALDSKEIARYDFQSFALFLHELELSQLTIVSTNQVIGSFCKKLAAEVQLVGEHSLQVSHRNEDLSTPGPDYIATLGEETTCGEQIEPLELVRSLNVYDVQKQRKRERSQVKRLRSSKSVSLYKSRY